MNHVRKLVAVRLIALLSIATLTWAQVADDSREKWEKVSDILAALQAEPGKWIADVGAGGGFVHQELQAAKFEVIEQRPDFLAFTSPGHKGGFWLMIAGNQDKSSRAAGDNAGFGRAVMVEASSAYLAADVRRGWCSDSLLLLTD